MRRQWPVLRRISPAPVDSYVEKLGTFRAEFLKIGELRGRERERNPKTVKPVDCW